VTAPSVAEANASAATVASSPEVRVPQLTKVTGISNQKYPKFMPFSKQSREIQPRWLYTPLLIGRVREQGSQGSTKRHRDFCWFHGIEITDVEFYNFTANATEETLSQMQSEIDLDIDARGIAQQAKLTYALENSDTMARSKTVRVTICSMTPTDRFNCWANGFRHPSSTPQLLWEDAMRKNCTATCKATTARAHTCIPPTAQPL
jgi:hypothetical protein